MEPLLLESAAGARPATSPATVHLLTVAGTALAVGVLPFLRAGGCEPAIAGAAVTGMAAIHALLATTGRWHPWLSTAALAANQPLLAVGTGAYTYACFGADSPYYDGYDKMAEARYAVPTMAIWFVASAVICWLTDASDAWFWRAKSIAYIVAEYYTFIHAAGTVEVKGATGLALATVAAVVALSAIVRLSPTPYLDCTWAITACTVVGMRVGYGFHVHHSEWPLYVAVAVRRWPAAAGAMVGWSLQEASGAGGFRLWAWQR